MVSGSARAKLVLIYVALIVLAVLFFLPFYWMVILATHSSKTILRMPPPLLPGDQFLNNYRLLLDSIPLWRNFLNSLIIAVSSTMLTLLFCSVGGFAFAMYRFPGRDFLFGFLIFTMMIPWIASLVPWFIIISRIGWINRYESLIFPGAVSAFGIFWMRQYISANCPRELMDSARIDGCPEYAIFFRIYAPILLPAYGALGILTFMNNWNSFFYPMIVMQTKKMFTLPLALNFLQSDPYRGMDFGVLMNGTAMAVGPVMIVFWMASRRFISGLTVGAVKG
jgi:ABC-type glycerol-3-phosphate transport system permease component